MVEDDDDSDDWEGCATQGWGLLPGQRVRAKIVSQQLWGVFAKIIGYEQVAASIDILAQFGGGPNREVEAMFPPAGAGIDTVVADVRRWDGPTRVRLSIRPEDLKDGPGSHQVISHRECLADRLHPDSGGERA